MTLCEWCGDATPQPWYEVYLPDECCSFYICHSCVVAGEEAGGGTASCKACGNAGAIRSMDKVTST
jgi:hypothetical protein